MARFLALDWDQNQLHLIVGNTRGSTVQVQRASVWQEGQIPNPANAEDLGKLLRDRLREAGIAPAPVLACVARDRLIVKEVRFPPVPEREEPAIVRFQAVKELTDAAEDVVIDYVVTSGKEGGGERRASVLVVRREQLETYQKLCQAAGLKLAALTPRLIGVSACVRKVMGTTVVTPAPEPADGVIGVVVIGEKTAEFCVLRGSTFLLSRSMPVGTNLAVGIRSNLSVHAGQSPQNPVRAVYLSGKGSGELRERLSELIDVPVHTFDPFAGAETLELPVGQRGAFAGAMGLLHARAEGDLPINFVSPRQPKPPQNINYRHIRLGVAASIAFFVGLFVIGSVVMGQYKDDLERVRQEKQVVEADLFRARENGKRLKAIDDWDNAVLLDELYELAALIPDVNALRVKSITTEPLARSANLRFVTRAIIKGELLNRALPRRPLDQLITQFTREGYYSPEAPKVEGNHFTLVVNVERRAPPEYKYVLKDVPGAIAPRAESKSKGKGKMGAFGPRAEGAEADAGRAKGKTRGKGKRGE